MNNTLSASKNVLLKWRRFMCSIEPSRLNLRKTLKEGKVKKSDEENKKLITVTVPEDVSTTSGMPNEERKSRLVRIFKPSKTTM